MLAKLLKNSNKCIWISCPYCGSTHKHLLRGFPWQEHKYKAPCNKLTYYIPDGALQKCIEDSINKKIINGGNENVD